MSNMPGLVWKTINGKRYLVLRWKKRVNGKLKITREIYVGDLERLASILENPGHGMEVSTLSFGTSSMCMLLDSEVGLRNTIDTVIDHRDTGHSPGDYALIFIMNRLSHPGSKNSISEWMRGDFSSTLFNKVTSQGYWNSMDRYTDSAMAEIKSRLRDRLISLGHDPSTLFVDGSNFFTFMRENDMAKKGHNKAHRYDLNQVSYYLAANEDYIPFYGDSYPGNIHNSSTFKWIVGNIPESSRVIFDRGYNSESNVKLLREREYIGALVQSDHMDLMRLPVGKDSFTETSKHVYGKDHRIIVYHSSKLEKKQILRFMKKFSRAYAKVRSIMESGDSDALQRAQYYLESVHLQETILLPDLSINRKRMGDRLSAMGKGALFTNIRGMDASGIMDLYRKRNRVEHCFRIISMDDLAKPEYHWTPQKIKVHMFYSYLAYMFLALMRWKVSSVTDASLESVTNMLGTIRIIYLARGREVEKRIVSNDSEGERIIEALDLRSVV